MLDLAVYPSGPKLTRQQEQTQGALAGLLPWFTPRRSTAILSQLNRSASRDGAHLSINRHAKRMALENTHQVVFIFWGVEYVSHPLLENVAKDALTKLKAFGLGSAYVREIGAETEEEKKRLFTSI